MAVLWIVLLIALSRVLAASFLPLDVTDFFFHYTGGVRQESQLLYDGDNITLYCPRLSISSNSNDSRDYHVFPGLWFESRPLVPAYDWQLDLNRKRNKNKN